MVYPNTQSRYYQRGGNFRGKKYQRGKEKQDGGFLGKLFGLGGGGGKHQQQKAQPINLNVNQRTSQNANSRRNGSQYIQRPYRYVDRRRRPSTRGGR